MGFQSFYINFVTIQNTLNNEIKKSICCGAPGSGSHRMC